MNSFAKKSKMNKVFIFLLLILLFGCANKKQDANLLDAAKLVANPIGADGKISGDTSYIPKIHFTETEFDFGNKIMEGEVVTHIFKFKNYGTAPLIISKAETSCGCTASEFSTEPVAPGAEGKIKITYDSNGRPGSFQKSVEVIANTLPNETKLLIIGDVKPMK